MMFSNSAGLAVQAVGVGMAAIGVTALVFEHWRKTARPFRQCRTAAPNAQPELKADAHLLRRLLDVIEHEILPKTQQQVEEGNKFFGAAILNAEGATVVADTNHEMCCPLYHGEVYTIQQWSELVGEKPAASESIFLATHEPCCMCVSAIVWAGFNKCFFLFPYETTRNQGIPHDINIMHELWNVDSFVARNQFLASAGIVPLIDALDSEEDKAELHTTISRITNRYNTLAKKYHSEKASNAKHSLVYN